MLHRANVHLDYLTPSPVRGQLEQYDPRAQSHLPGWRWLQTTETLDQFRVLLPPRTAHAYDHLLACERTELATDEPSWERILEIRHLKDRMIRKSQRLSSSALPKRLNRGESFSFQSVIAPPDFRLKEMEKWLQQQTILPFKRLSSVISDIPPSQTPQPVTPQLSHKKSFCCDKCSPTGTSVQQHFHPVPEAPLPIKLSSSQDSAAQDDNLDSPISPSSPVHRSRSPSPLPMLPRSSMTFSQAGGEGEQTNDNGDSTPPTHLPRKRSILKRASLNDSMKSVSWADGTGHLVDELIKASSTTNHPLDESKLNSITTSYHDHVSSLEQLQKAVQASLAQMKLDISKLEDMESTVSEQKRILSSTFGAFEKKRRAFQSQVQGALQDEPPRATSTGEGSEGPP